MLFLIIIPPPTTTIPAPFSTRRYWLDLTAQDVLWNTSDTGWAKTAWSSVYSAWIQGACVFVHRMPRFDTSTVLRVRLVGVEALAARLSSKSQSLISFSPQFLQHSTK